MPDLVGLAAEVDAAAQADTAAPVDQTDAMVQMAPTAAMVSALRPATAARSP
jgi:hypothetical protein